MHPVLSRDESLHVSSDEEGCNNDYSSGSYKIKQSSSHKGPYHFNKLKLVQDIAVHVVSVTSYTSYSTLESGLFITSRGRKNLTNMPE